jgi:hypothetical protein
VVEGGTLLRCYTSERGIEGSNPSSSALTFLPFCRTGRNPSPIYTTEYTNAARKGLSQDNVASIAAAV